MNRIKTVLIILFSIILTIDNLGQNIAKADGTLPVELVYFVGDVADSTVEIRWGTATEVNNYGYDILRADTSFVWEDLDFVQGHGNSYSPKDYLFIDTTITENGDYFYLLKQIDFDGKYELTHDTVKINVGYLTSVNNEFEEAKTNPENFQLFQNYPNPFNPETNITFKISKRNFITLKLFSIRGEEITTIYSGIVTEGIHTLKFKPIGLSSGTYIYKLDIGNKSVSKKMLFIK